MESAVVRCLFKRPLVAFGGQVCWCWAQSAGARPTMADVVAMAMLIGKIERLLSLVGFTTA
jgi:hypothetical protein